jgi:hypothetical protein
MDIKQIHKRNIEVGDYFDLQKILPALLTAENMVLKYIKRGKKMDCVQ